MQYYATIEQLPKVRIKYGILHGARGRLVEKNLDTQLTADLIIGAAKGRYDIAILISGRGRSETYQKILSCPTPIRHMTTYRYNVLQRTAKRLYRVFFPVPGSPWTAGEVEDICAINLVPPERLIGFFKECIQRLREFKGEEVGDYLEFGIFNGNSIGSLFLARKETNVTSMRLFGFDAFEGLPAGSEQEDDGVWKKGFYACSFEQMSQCLKRREIDPEEITWVKGWYDQTLNNETAERLTLKNIGIVFIDCDTYSSSKAVLDFLAPLIQAPVIICLDDWKLNDLDIQGMGEYKAFNEFLEKNTHLTAEEIPSYNRKSKTFLVRSK